MIGVVIVGHCNLANELLIVVKMISGEVKNFAAVDFDTMKTSDDSIKKVASAVKKVDDGDGVLILTDMFGGTPSNLSLSLLESDKVEVITGVNLPILIKLITLRENGHKLNDLAKELKFYGRKNICIASEILRNDKPPGK